MKDSKKKQYFTERWEEEEKVSEFLVRHEKRRNDENARGIKKKWRG